MFSSNKQINLKVLIGIKNAEMFHNRINFLQEVLPGMQVVSPPTPAVPLQKQNHCHFSNIYSY